MNNRNVKRFTIKYFHLRLFTRKLVITTDPGRSSGSFHVEHLPGGLLKRYIFTRPRYLRAKSSGMKIQQAEEMLPPGTYSYGDSAGFTPDFPFNPPVRGEPKSLQRWEYPL